MSVNTHTPNHLGHHSAPRVALLVDTSTSWGRRIIAGVHHYIRGTGGWQVFVEARGLEESLEVPCGWESDGVIARVSSEAR